MKLLPEWRAVLVRIWSIRLIAIAVVLDGLSTAFPYLQDTFGLPTGTFECNAHNSHRDHPSFPDHRNGLCPSSRSKTSS
ncbi:DUF7940 domain-containing protein [Phyllobacterium sp. TAF24]|uniref:DUF7940 domain-containing protein n=1 Tax=Phyllobacterium sp. TAF24 TaxID=3233068 RepID=UPI003F95B83C